MSDVADIEPTFTVGPWFWHTDSWLKLLLLLVSITYYIISVFKAFEALFSKLGPFSKLKSSPFQLPSSSEFCCTWLMCGNKYKNAQRQFTKYFICYHARKQKKLYVKHQCSKKCWTRSLETTSICFFCCNRQWWT